MNMYAGSETGVLVVIALHRALIPHHLMVIGSTGQSSGPLPTRRVVEATRRVTEAHLGLDLTG